jgi:topoisomerase-4 subunit A
MMHLEKWIPEKAVSAVYYDGSKESWFVKRFLVEHSSKAVKFISEDENSRLGLVTTLHFPQARIRFNKKFKKTRDKEDEIVDLWEFISIKGLKAIGNKLSAFPVTEVFLEGENVEKEAQANELLIGSLPEENLLDVEDAEEVNDSEDVKSTDQNSKNDGEADSIVDPGSKLPEEKAAPKKKKNEPDPKAESDIVEDIISDPIELSITDNPEEDDDDGQITMF